MNPMKPWFYPNMSHLDSGGSLVAPQLAPVSYGGCSIWGLNIMEYMTVVQGYSMEQLSISNPNLTLAQAVCGEINMATDFMIPANTMYYLGLPTMNVDTSDLDPSGNYTSSFKFNHVVGKFFGLLGDEGYVYTRGISDAYPTFLDINNDGVFNSSDRNKFWCVDPEAGLEGGQYAC